MAASMYFLCLSAVIGASWGQNEWLRSRFTTLKDLFFRGDLEHWQAPMFLQKNYPYYLSGFDDENRPIWVVEFGKWDVRKIVEGNGQMMRDFDKYCSQAVWRVVNSTTFRSTLEYPVTEYTGIVDFDGYSLQQLSSTSTIQFIMNKARQLREVMKMLDNGFCINVSFVADKLLSLLRPLLGKDFERVEVLGTNKSKWLPILLRRYPQSQLPPWYGGFRNFIAYQYFG